MREWVERVVLEGGLRGWVSRVGLEGVSMGCVIECDKVCWESVLIRRVDRVYRMEYESHPMSPPAARSASRHTGQGKVCREADVKPLSLSRSLATW